MTYEATNEDADETTYCIWRYHQNDRVPRLLIAEGLSLKEATEHCSSAESSSQTCSETVLMEYTREHGAWFDGFTEE